VLARGFSLLRTGLTLLPFTGAMPAGVGVTNRGCLALRSQGILGRSGTFRAAPAAGALPPTVQRAPWRQMMRGAGDLRKFSQARQAAGCGPAGWPQN